MATRTTEIKVGLFVVASAVVLLAGLVFIAGSGLFKEKDTYLARFAFSSAIEENALVRMAGVEVGRVTGIAMVREGDDTVVEIPWRSTRIWKSAPAPIFL